MTHEIIKCREHGTLYAQCRCISPDKAVVFVDCDRTRCGDRISAAERDRRGQAWEASAREAYDQGWRDRDALNTQDPIDPGPAVNNWWPDAWKPPA